MAIRTAEQLERESAVGSQVLNSSYPVRIGMTVRLVASAATLRILSNWRDFGFPLLDKKADVDMLEVATL